MLVSDELPAYRGVGREHPAHHTVCHARDEFARTLGTGLRVHTITAESFHATLKRVIIGVFHHVSRKHLHRYSAEATFRWNRRRRPKTAVPVTFVVSGPLPFRALTAD